MEGVTPPTRRRCERCGRVDRWDDDTETWVAVEADERDRHGEPHCVHEWNVTGSYSPVDGA
jgi:hypothetical protein